MLPVVFKLLKLPLALLWLCLSNHGQTQELQFSSGHFEPYSGADLNGGGMVSQIIRQAFAQTDYQIKIVFLPWRRAYQYALDHKVDGSFPYTKNQTHSANFNYSAEIYRSKGKVFVLNTSSINQYNLHLRESFSTCVPLGYAESAFDALANFPPIEIIMRPTKEKSCLLGLLKNRIDMFITDELVAWHISSGISGANAKLRTIDIMTADLSYYLLVAKTNSTASLVLNRFNTGLKQLKATGAYADIINRYDSQLKLKGWAPEN